MSLDKVETYHGYVRTPGDAIKLFEACRLGLLPRVQRRLSEKERQSIRSGSVFVWDEREAGMRRWTDRKSWSASRVSGSFLTYREMEGKRGGGFGRTPDSGRGSDEDYDDGEPEGYRYKADGLMKQSFSITTTAGQHLRLISYYSRPLPGQPELAQPSSDPALRGIVPPKGMYPESSMGETNQTPAPTLASMQQPYMIAPQHAHAHTQPYGWPPSPAATPPYGHRAPAPFAPSAHPLPPPQASQQPAPLLAYAHSRYTHAPPHERTSLPPLQISKQNVLPAYQNNHGAPPRLHEPTRLKDLQTAAQAAVGDSPAGNSLARGVQGPLSALNSVTKNSTASRHGVAGTPPMRHSSVSPPRSLHAESSMSRVPTTRPNLSALLHPTPAISEPGSAKTTSSGSANSSPRVSGLVLDQAGVIEDARALRMLGRKFCT